MLICKSDIVSRLLFAVMMIPGILCVNVWADEPVESSTKDIPLLLKTQAECWNRADIEGFMETYWKSEKLTFSAGGKTTRGWQATLDRYKKSYPADKMGQLKFSGLEVTPLGSEAALVLGKWHLELPGKAGKVTKGGNFSLVLQKLGGKWKIIHDHSSSLESKGETSQDKAEENEDKK